ncbi:MAG: InlB B-repeat-containing protein [Chitinispirillales bacterium]|nr:InlB B-repeat-containing protein [Chitinispirillales bacterium]
MPFTTKRISDRKIAVFLLAMVFFSSSAFAQRVQLKNIAVVEAQINELPGAEDEINRPKIEAITNRIRREAVNNLPIDRFKVMTPETVLAMGAMAFEECAEENCVIAIGSKIGADYIVRGIISKSLENFTLTVEMYETRHGMFVAVSDPVQAGKLEELTEKSNAACAAMYQNFLKTGSPASSQPTVTPQSSAAYNLTVNIKPDIGGIVTRSPNQTSYAPGTLVTLTVIPAQGAGYRFAGWSGALTSRGFKETVVMDSNITLTANFGKTYSLTTRTNPRFGGAVSRVPDMVRYDANTPITLTAAPAAGYRFIGWSRASVPGLISRDSLMKGTMNINLSLTAHFARPGEEPLISSQQMFMSQPPVDYTLAVNINPKNSGTVTRAPSQIRYAPGTVVTVSAEEGREYRFLGWSGALTSEKSKETVVMDSSMTLTANFKKTYSLTTRIEPYLGGSVSREPNMVQYEADTPITLTAIPAKGYRFVGWSRASAPDLISTDSVMKGTMNRSLSLTAHFAKIGDKPR